MKKLNVTPGEFKAEGVSIVRIEDGYIHAALPEDDAILYSDSLTTYNKCGKIPSELELQNRELIEALRNLCSSDPLPAMLTFEQAWAACQALLTKIENNQTPQP